jgi:branched-chain amino acid transport system permease protein
MTAVGSAGTQRTAGRSLLSRAWRRWTIDQNLRKLAGCLLTAVTVAVMTGPSGSNSSATHGFTGSLFDVRIIFFLAAGVVLWALIVGRQAIDRPLRQALQWTHAVHMPADRRVRYPVYLVILALAIVVPHGLSGFWQEVLVDQIGVYVLLALGLNVVVGFAGLLDLGYIAFYAIGAYSTAYWTDALPIKPPFHVTPFITIVFGVIAAMVAGVILGTPTLRLRGDYLAIVTLGFGGIIQLYANNLQSVTGGSQGSNPVPHFSIDLPGIHYKWKLANLPYYYVLLVFVLVVLIAFRLLENSRVGRAWAAIREDEVAAEASGVNTYKYKLMAFAIGASTSGLAGALFASKIQTVTPASFALQQSILVLVLVIFGGMGSIIGAIVGATILEWAPQELRHHFPPQDLFLYFGALLIVMMIYRPQGVVPSRRRSRELGIAEAGLAGPDAMSPPIDSPTSPVEEVE